MYSVYASYFGRTYTSTFKAESEAEAIRKMKATVQAEEQDPVSGQVPAPHLVTILSVTEVE